MPDLCMNTRIPALYDKEERPKTFDKYTYSTVPDPHVFGPPGSGSASQRYGSGSGSGFFYHQAKIVRKTLTPILLDFF
jgi:hypothetical protein